MENSLFHRQALSAIASVRSWRAEWDYATVIFSGPLRTDITICAADAVEFEGGAVAEGSSLALGGAARTGPTVVGRNVPVAVAACSRGPATWISISGRIPYCLGLASPCVDGPFSSRAKPVRRFPMLSEGGPVFEPHPTSEAYFIFRLVHLRRIVCSFYCETHGLV